MLNEIAAELVECTITLTKQTLQETHSLLGRQNLPFNIVCAGGSSHLHLVQSTLKGEFPNQVLRMHEF